MLRAFLLFAREPDLRLLRRRESSLALFVGSRLSRVRLGERRGVCEGAWVSCGVMGAKRSVSILTQRSQRARRVRRRGKYFCCPSRYVSTTTKKSGVEPPHSKVRRGVGPGIPRFRANGWRGRRTTRVRRSLLRRVRLRFGERVRGRGLLDTSLFVGPRLCRRFCPGLRWILLRRGYRP